MIEWRGIGDMQPEGNYYDKYNSNNIIEKFLMKNFFNKCASVLKEIDCDGGLVLEAGCGEGNFTCFLYNQLKDNITKMEAFDISERCVEEAKEKCPQVSFKTGSIYEINKNKSYNLVVASEVLEHMDSPELAMDELLKASQKYVLITVPNEPLWRILNMARGKYWNDLGNTPGHVQHWNRTNIVDVVQRNGRGKVEKILTACPWLIILVRVIV